jgi:hypothetical protein
MPCRACRAETPSLESSKVKRRRFTSDSRAIHVEIQQQKGRREDNNKADIAAVPPVRVRLRLKRGYELFPIPLP